MAAQLTPLEREYLAEGFKRRAELEREEIAKIENASQLSAWAAFNSGETQISKHHKRARAAESWADVLRNMPYLSISSFMDDLREEA